MEPQRDPEGIEIEALKRTGSTYGRSVLEIGCGDGRLIWRYAAYASQVAGVDPEIEKLADVTTTRPDGLTMPLIHGSGLNLAQAQAEHLPFADESFQSAIFGWSL